MLFRTLVLLTAKVNLLMKGVLCRLAGDCYRGGICLSGAGEMGKDHEDGANDNEHVFIKRLLFF